MDVGYEFKFRNSGIEEFRNSSRPGSIPGSLNLQFLYTQIAHLTSHIGCFETGACWAEVSPGREFMQHPAWFLAWRRRYQIRARVVKDKQFSLFKKLRMGFGQTSP
jgi:hypothetical protein